VALARHEPEAAHRAAIGSILGIIGAYLSRWSSATASASPTQSFLQIMAC